MKQKRSQKRIWKLPPWMLLTPYGIIFAVFIIIPVGAAAVLSFTYFNTIQPPEFIGLQNYIDLFTTDSTFLRYVVPNTITYALFVGVGGYIPVSYTHLHQDHGRLQR